MIHVWRCDLDTGSATDALLDSAEQKRAAAFHFPHLRRRYVAAHCFLRSVLAPYLGMKPAVIEFIAGIHGKPALRDSHGVQFNLSHADGVAYLAVTDTGEIGLDVELEHRVDDALAVGSTVFCAREMTQIEDCSDDARDRAFLHAWTRKEAYVKALGFGIGAVELKAIDVGATPDPHMVAPIAGVCREAIHIRSLDGFPREIVAVATMVVPDNIKRHEYRIGTES